LPAKIDGGRPLEQFPEVIDAGDDDEQAAQGVSHCMESVALDQEDIRQGDDGICQENDIECFLGAASIDDLPEHIQVEREFYCGRDVAEEAVIDFGNGEVIFHPGKDAAEQEEEREIPEPALVCAEEKDRQAC
jgi:hypothetical protein